MSVCEGGNVCVMLECMFDFCWRHSKSGAEGHHRYMFVIFNIFSIYEYVRSRETEKILGKG